MGKAAKTSKIPKIAANVDSICSRKESEIDSLLVRYWEKFSNKEFSKDEASIKEAERLWAALVLVSEMRKRLNKKLENLYNEA